MINGIVHPSAADGTGLEAWVDIAIAGEDRVFRTLAAVIDTGATDWLTLPDSLVRELGLRHTGERQVSQVHGPSIRVDVYAVWILWYGRIRRVFAESGNDTLIGTDLLADSRLIIDWWDGGEVIIEEPACGGLSEE